MKRIIGREVLIVALAWLPVSWLARAIADASAKSEQKRAMSLARDVASLSFSGKHWGRFGEWQRKLCATRTDGGAAAVMLSELELRRMLALIGADTAEVAALGSLGAIQAGTYCNCASGVFWFKVGDLVWSDGYFISLPAYGLSRGSGLGSGRWQVHPKDCQSEPLP